MPITQASRTIIFEEFADMRKSDNQLSDRLDVLLSSNLTEQQYHNISKKLSVKSFQEFLEKFDPTIYEQQLTDDEESVVTYKYSLEKPDGKYTEYNAQNDKFFELINMIYTNRSSSGNDNVRFNYDQIKDVISPKSVQDDIKRKRRLLDYHMNEFQKQTDKESYVAKSHKQECIKIVAEIKEKYFSGSMKAFLPIVLADIMDQIEYIDSLSQNDSDVQGGSPLVLMPGDMFFNEKGNIEMHKSEIKKLTGDDGVKRLSDGERAKMRTVKLLGASYDSAMVAVTENTTLSAEQQEKYLKSQAFVKDTLMRVFSGTTATSALGITRDTLIKQRDEYAKIYTNMQESFSHQMVNLVEKMMNVKVFFDHAAVNGIVDPEVLIANCKITDLMDGGEVESNFKTYINQMGNEIKDLKIWYAVVPGIRDVEYADADEMDMYNIDDGGAFDDDLEVEYVVEGGEKTVQALNAKKMRPVERGFVSYDDTSFANLKVDTVKSYKRKVQNLENKEFGVLCYPNFTIIPKEQKEYELFPRQTVELPSVYLDSSYVACAMMILAHNNRYLRDKGFTVNGDLPAVRFDYEVSFKNSMANGGMAPCWQIITTKLNKKSSLPFLMN